MSYHTSHHLSWEGKPSKQEVADHLAQHGEYQNESPQIWLQMLEGEQTKWYEHQHDLQGVSAKWPKTLFTLHRGGEDDNDLAYEYYRGGKVQICPGTITYPEFDPSKLKR